MQCYAILMNQFIHRTINESGLTFADVARKMGVTPQAVHNLADTDQPRFKTLVKLLTAIGWTQSAIESVTLGEVYGVSAAPHADNGGAA